jgi:hypothetical protein
MSPLSANAQTKNVYQLFSGKVFRVPAYQRNYSWDIRNWEDLWNDIKEGLATNTEHYWGTITLRDTGLPALYCDEKDIPFNIYEVVDGQQRITSLYLFLLAICRIAKPVIKENFIKTGQIYRLELGGLNNQFLKELVDGKDPHPVIKTNRLIKDALDYFVGQIQSYGKLDDISKYLQISTFSLEFAVQDPMLAVKAFESLNDRGKALTLLDRTKSLLMFYSLRYLNSKLGDKVNEVFGHVFTDYDIIKESGEKHDINYLRSRGFSEDELLRFFYHYFAYYAIRKYSLGIGYDYDITAEEVFSEFLKQACIHLKDSASHLEGFLHDFISDLGRFTAAFQMIVSRVSDDIRYRKLFSFLGINARVYPLVVALEAEGVLNLELLHIAECVDVKIYKVRGTDPRADLYRDTICQIKINPDVSRIGQSIGNFLSYFADEPGFRYFLNLVRYRNPAIKYILWELEKHNEPSFDDSNYDLYRQLEVDHIFSRETTLSFPAYGFQDQEDYNANKDRLGNLCLLESELNKRAGQDTLANKFRYYQQSVVLGTKALGFMIQNRIFTKEDIENRGAKIVDFCATRW